MASVPYPTDRYNRFGARGLRARIARGPLVVQAPPETALLGLPDSAGIPAALWNVAEPQTVARLHALEAAAGAELLLTNTRRATAPLLAVDRVRQSPAEVNRAAVAAARRTPGTFILGVVAPCGLDASADDAARHEGARTAYRDQIHQLLVASADGILLDGFSSLREIEPALAGAADVLDGMPLAVRFEVDAAGELPAGDLNIEAAIRHAAACGAEMVGASCPNPASAGMIAARLRALTDLPLLVSADYPGDPHPDDDGLLVWDERPQDLAAAARSWLDAGVVAIGGGTGSTARTTAALAAILPGE